MQLYQFLARRTNSNFNKVILKRLMAPRRLRAPLSLSRLSLRMRKEENKTAVVVGSIVGRCCGPADLGSKTVECNVQPFLHKCFFGLTASGSFLQMTCV